jgi:glycosyltransferase involved in cell wall biosynthesis
MRILEGADMTTQFETMNLQASSIEHKTTIGSEKPIDVSVIIPAYNETKIIGSVIERVFNTLEDLGLVSEVLVIDDGSLDGTKESAESCGVQVIRHPYNIGNGAAVKTGIRNSRGNIIVVLDGDGQHNPEDIPDMLNMLELYDMVVGSRIKGSVSSIHRNFANKIYNWLASYVCGLKIQDLTSGFRAIRADIAREFIYLLPNTFSYPTTITLAIVRSGYSLGYVPIKTRKRIGKSKINLLRDGSRFFLIIFKIATLFSPLKIFVPISLMTFLLGFGYGLFKVVVLNSRYGPTSAMLMTMALLIFLIGLVAEQVSQLRFDRIDMLK